MASMGVDLLRTLGTTRRARCWAAENRRFFAASFSGVFAAAAEGIFLAVCKGNYRLTKSIQIQF